MNELPHGKRALLKRLLAHGASHRAIALAVPCGKAAVVRYAKIWQFNPICLCGKRAGHRGWCEARLEFSTQRRGWLADKWKKRSDSALSQIVDAANKAATAQGHHLGPYIWSAGETASIAYTVCSVCGKMVRIWSENPNVWREERFDGTAITNPCETPEQVAADKAAREEKRKWHEGRKKLWELRKILRGQSHSRRRASIPDQSLRP